MILDFCLEHREKERERKRESDIKCKRITIPKQQAQLRVPHSRIQVQLGFILQAGTCQVIKFTQNPRLSQSVQDTKLNWWGGNRTEKVYTGGGDATHIF